MITSQADYEEVEVDSMDYFPEDENDLEYIDDSHPKTLKELEKIFCREPWDEEGIINDKAILDMPAANPKLVTESNKGAPSNNDPAISEGTHTVPDTTVSNTGPTNTDIVPSTADTTVPNADNMDIDTPIEAELQKPSNYWKPTGGQHVEVLFLHKGALKWFPGKITRFSKHPNTKGLWNAFVHFQDGDKGWFPCHGEMRPVKHQV